MLLDLYQLLELSILSLIIVLKSINFSLKYLEIASKCILAKPKGLFMLDFIAIIYPYRCVTNIFESSLAITKKFNFSSLK